MKNKITQKELVMEYFTKHPKKDIPHPEIVDWVVAEYKKRTGKFFETLTDKLDSFIKVAF
jgi:hypothetical protein